MNVVMDRAEVALIEFAVCGLIAGLRLPDDLLFKNGLLFTHALSTFSSEPQLPITPYPIT
jgi:hypothetical protein